MIQGVTTFRATRWMLLQRLLGVITNWKPCGREHGDIIVVTERNRNILSETRSTGIMAEFKKPGRRPDKGNTEWISLSLSLYSVSVSLSLSLSWPTHLLTVFSKNKFSINRLFSKPPHTQKIQPCVA